MKSANDEADRPTGGWPAWTQPFYWRESLLCLPAMPLMLWLSLLRGDELSGAIAAGAAFSVGFGASRALRGRRWGAMLAATVGTTLAAFFGTVAGQHLWSLMAIAGVAAAICAALALIDDDLWWVMLQGVIALLVAGYFGGSSEAGLERATAVLIGGVVQIVCVVVLARLIPSARSPLPAAPPKEPAERAMLAAHAARAAACVVLALLAAHLLGLANSYWAPMTAMLVLKPGLHDTRIRGVARLSGTLAGCFVATLYVLAMRDEKAWLVAGLALTAGSAFALQKANYATMTAAVTATVVLLLSLSGGSVLAHAEHRLVATAIGGLIAIAVAAVLPHRPAPAAVVPDRVGSGSRL